MHEKTTTTDISSSKRDNKPQTKLWSGRLIILLLLAVIAIWLYRFSTDYSAAISFLHANMWVAIAFGSFALGDDITTEIALRQSHGEGELNPIANKVFRKKHGKLIFTILKWILLSVILLVFAASGDYKALLFLTAAYGLVVLNNMRAIAEYILCRDITLKIRALPTNNRMYLIRVSSIFIIAAFIAYGAEHIL